MNDYERHLFKTIHWSTAKDYALFLKWTGMLPKRDKDTPYHSGPQNEGRFRDALALAQPETVVEIGFNLGHSAAIMLGLGVKKVISIQPTASVKTQLAIDELIARYGSRFKFILGDSTQTLVPVSRVDLLFIDGDHSFTWAMNDITFGLLRGIHTFLLDDYDSHHGPGVVKAVENSDLVVRALFGTMALCTT